VYGLGFKPVVVVHGGAGVWRGLDLDMGAVVKTLKEAVMIGLDVSRSGVASIWLLKL
jgi:hypothetical protein